MPSFSEKLRALMGRYRIKQDELAELMRTQQSRISRWVNDEGIPNIEQGLRLSRIFEVPLEYLADDTLVEPKEITLSIQERALLDVARQAGIDKLFSPDVGEEEISDYLSDLEEKYSTRVKDLALEHIKNRYKPRTASGGERGQSPVEPAEVKESPLLKRRKKGGG